MTVEELEGKLTNIYHEFAETISENETDEQIVARSKEWFVKRLSEETDNKEAIESIANQLVGCLKQASVLSNLEKEKMNKVQMCSGSTYTQVSSGYSVEQSLPVGIYSICLTMTGYHLDRYADKFVFPYKMYGFLLIRINSLLKSSPKLLRDSTIRCQSPLQTMRITVLLRKEKLLTSIMNIAATISTICHITMYLRILSSQIWQLEMTSMMTKLLRLTRNQESQLLKTATKLITTGLKIQIVNRLCIVEVLTTLWYYKTWGASLPFMSRCPSGLRERSAKPCFVGSNPTLDSTLILLLMDRELRRELSKRKWISRAKKVYNACGKFYVPVAGIKANVRYNVPIIRNKALKVCESITDFLDSSKYAKMLKNCTSPYRSRMMQYEYKKENRKDRYKAKRDIQEGIQEYESRDNLSCSSCIFYDKGFCEKGLLMTENCPEYWD